MSNIKKEVYSIAIIVAINIITIALVFGLTALMKIKYGIWFFIGYIMFSILIYLLWSKYPNKATKLIYYIVISPWTLLRAFMIIAIPPLSIQMVLYFYLGLAFLIPLLLKNLDINFSIFSLQPETWTYIVLTIGCMFAFLGNKILRYFVYRVFPFTASKSDRAKNSTLLELNDYIISKNNIRFVIFFIYFIYLIIINFLNLEGENFYTTPENDTAVLQSFVTFIAFDRILAASQNTEFKPSKLLSILKSSISQIAHRIDNDKSDTIKD